MVLQDWPLYLLGIRIDTCSLMIGQRAMRVLFLSPTVVDVLFFREVSHPYFVSDDLFWSKSPTK